MPYLKSAHDAAAALGVSSGGNQPYTNDVRFTAMLAGSTAQIERLLGTPLAQAGYRDTFVIDSRFVRNTEELRLAAGFVDPASVVVTNPYGETLNSDQYAVRAELGVVVLTAPRGGKYTVQYNAGFAVGADDIFVDTPDWLKSLVDQACTIWLRSIGTPRAIEGLSYGQHMSVVYKQVAGSVYGRYQRPRPPAHYPLAVEVLPVF